MLKKFYLKDQYNNKIYVEHYFLEEKRKENSKSKIKGYKNNRSKSEENNKNKNIVVLFHGLLENCNLEKYNILTSFLLDNNFEVLKFDYTGHGNSKGSFNIKFLLSNIKAIYNYIENYYNNHIKSYKNNKYNFNIYFVPYSISGYGVLKFLKTIEEKNDKNDFIKKVVFLNPYFGYSNLDVKKLLDLKKIFSFLFFRKATFYNKYNNVKAVISKSFIEERKKLLKEYKSKKIFSIKSKIKFFIIHSKYDKNVPLKSSEYAYNELSKNNFVLLYIVEDDHYFRKTFNIVVKKIIHFLKV